MSNGKEKYIYAFIGFNDPHVHKRGVENIILLQAQALIGRKVFYIFFGHKNKAFKWGSIIGISVRKFDFLSLNLILRFLKKKYSAQLFIHSHNYQLSFLCYYDTNVFTVHDSLTYLYGNLKRKYIFLFKLIERAVYKRAKKIHFISEFTKSKCLFDSKYNYKSIIIYNSTPLEQINNQATKNKETKNDIIQIFSVRSIEKRARIDLLIEVCNELSKSPYPIVLSIAGKGEFLSHYKQIIKDKKIDNLILLGYVSDKELIDHYIKSNLIILPAEYGEGFGLPIIEGYLFGKPVIASNKCAIPEVIINDNMLFENDVNSILDKIFHFVANRHSLSDSSQYINYYESRFSNTTIVNLYKQKLYGI